MTRRRSWWRGVVAVGTVGVVTTAWQAPSPAAATTTRCVPASVSDVRDHALSPDGRFVAFGSWGDLVPEDDNLTSDIYLHDVARGVTRLVTVEPADGSPVGGHDADAVDVSTGGRYVTYGSLDPDQTPGQDGPGADVFVRDMAAGETELVSVDHAGGPADGASSPVGTSADGRWVLFHSQATDIVDDGAGGGYFLRDRLAGTTARAAVPGTVDAFSENGRYVVYRVVGPPVGPGPRPRHQINHYRFDLGTGASLLVTGDTAGEEGDRQSYSPRISPDGRFVSFYSNSNGLVPGDSGTDLDTFLRDTRRGTTVLTDAAVMGFSAGGRYRLLSTGAAMVAEDDNGENDVYRYDALTGETVLASVASDGGTIDGYSGYAEISADGSTVAWRSYAADVATGCPAGAVVFVRRLPG